MTQSGEAVAGVVRVHHGNSCKVALLGQTSMQGEEGIYHVHKQQTLF
jgi:hypothetical protein